VHDDDDGELYSEDGIITDPEDGGTDLDFAQPNAGWTMIKYTTEGGWEQL